MDNGANMLLDGNAMYENITNIEWLGETEEDAISGGPNGSITGGNEGSGRDGVPVAYAVSVPLLVLLAVALLIARNRTRREAMTPGQLDVSDKGIHDVLVGTGDPPRSFHEGMYHYTRYGARYLSTNCPDCIVTKRNGIFADSDLETIQEGIFESFEEISLVPTSASSNGKDDGEYSSSGYRKRNLVPASDTALGVKHSSVDVHQCTSSTCPICIYRPVDVSFVGHAGLTSPRNFGSTIDV
jgi:hypothetical protein